jgi:hypothetical protein
MVTPINQQFSRFDNSYLETAHIVKTANETLDEIISCFMEMNLSLLTARACSGEVLPTFFRRNPQSNDHYSSLHSTPELRSKRQNIFMGFLKANSKFGFASGTMQLLKERYSNDECLAFEACWIEMDDVTFAAYELADDVPLAYVPIQDIRSISPLPIEPEGHVFEIILRHGQSYRFVATDPEARKAWVDIIEENMNKTRRALKSTRPGSMNIKDEKNDKPISERVDTEDDREKFNSIVIGYADVDNDNYKMTPEEEMAMSKFRFKVNQTQMVINMNSNLECGDYEEIFRQFDPDRPFVNFAEELFRDEGYLIERFLPKNISANTTDFLKQVISPEFKDNITSQWSTVHVDMFINPCDLKEDIQLRSPNSGKESSTDTSEASITHTPTSNSSPASQLRVKGPAKVISPLVKSSEKLKPRAQSTKTLNPTHDIHLKRKDTDPGQIIGNGGEGNKDVKDSLSSEGLSQRITKAFNGFVKLYKRSSTDVRITF